MSNLHATIEKAASAFARSIIDAVKDSTLQELLALSGAPAASQTPKRGRPPKSAAVPGRKPGRPRKAVAKTTGKKSGKKAATKRKRPIKWPKCSVKGCKRNAWSRGSGMCGKHFKASKAG